MNSRAVILIDIAEFSLYTPFEQASQLNSLSYSLNSAYNKLLSRGIEINFARTTTGDGYYESVILDPDGTIVAYDWDFGDGNVGAGVGPTHAYATAGVYDVTL